MNEDFIKFSTYIIIFIILGLFWDSLKSDAANRKTAYLESKNKIQVQQYGKTEDLYKGVPVEVDYRN